MKFAASFLQVIFSEHLRINQKKWNLSIKTQKKNSFFVKKLAHAAYGPENLKVRTLALPGKKFKNKKVATPQKVDTITGEQYNKLFFVNK